MTSLTPWRRKDRDLTRTQWLPEPELKQLHRQLRELPDKHAFALTCLAPERHGDSNGTRSVPGSRPPLNIAVVDLTRPSKPTDDPMGLSDLSRMMGQTQLSTLGMLESWTRLIHSEMLDENLQPTEPTSPPTVTTEVDWLLRHIVWITEQQFVTELAQDIGRTTRDIAQILRERPEYQPTCPHCHAQLSEIGGYFACSACGFDARDDRMGMLGLVRRAEPMTTGQIARAFGVSASTLRSWRRRGLIEPAEDGPRPVWHVVDVLRLLDTGATRGRSGA